MAPQRCYSGEGMADGSMGYDFHIFTGSAAAAVAAVNGSKQVATFEELPAPFGFH